MLAAAVCVSVPRKVGHSGSRTKVPRPVSPLTRPMDSSSAYTREAVTRASPWLAASCRWVGRRVPGQAPFPDIGGVGVNQLLVARLWHGQMYP